MTQIVHEVRRQFSADGTHLHITHLLTRGEKLWPVALVAVSIRAGEPWLLSNDGYVISIRATLECPTSGCTHAPYLETSYRSPNGDNLENAPEAVL